jgi:hypothetical protein
MVGVNGTLHVLVGLGVGGCDVGGGAVELPWVVLGGGE